MASPVPHPGGLIRRFLACRHCLASARLLPSHQKSLKSCSPGCAKQFFRSGFSFRQGGDRREYFRIAKGGDAVWAEIRPQKPTRDLPSIAQPKNSFRGSREDFGLRQIFCSPLIILRRPIQELHSFVVQRIAAFDLVQPSYALAAFAVRYGSVLLPKNISASVR